MKTNRVFLILLVIVFFVSASAAQQNLPKTREILRSGPMLGYSEMTETVIWLQTRAAANAQIRFWKKGDAKNIRLSKIVKTNEDSDFIARLKIANLDFGTKYDFAVYLNDVKTKFDYQPTFQTQPHWRWRTEPPTFKFAFGSCAFINEEKFDRPGKPYGSGFEIFPAIARQKPDFMVWLGDNLYYREPDWLTETAMRHRNAKNRELPALRELLGTTHHYAIWDDHDYGANDSDWTFRGKTESLKIFKDYWANPSYGTEETKGVFGRFEWGDVEFFLLDDRYHRSPNDLPAAPDKVMFGEAQMKWLRESLTSSRATFKIIAGGNQMLNPILSYEAWGEFPNEQKKFLDFLRDAQIEGVMFLSGDRHLTELIKRDDLGTYPLYDYTSSPLTSGNAKPSDKEKDNPARVSGTLVTDIKNFGTIEVSGTAKDRKLTLKAIDLNGKELWKHEIRANELKFSNQ